MHELAPGRIYRLLHFYVSASIGYEGNLNGNALWSSDILTRVAISEAKKSSHNPFVGDTFRFVLIANGTNLATGLGRSGVSVHLTSRRAKSLSCKGVIAVQLFHLAAHSGLPKRKKESTSRF